MSRLMGRSTELYSLSKDFVEADLPKYKQDRTVISDNDLVDAPEMIRMYLPERAVKYIKEHPISVLVKRLNRGTTTIAPIDMEEDTPYMIVNSSKMREEYKRELIFFLGQLLSRINFDMMHLTDFTIPCQYGSFMSLYMDLLYHRTIGKEDEFSLKYLEELTGNAERYIKIYERYNKNPEIFDINKFMVDTLTFLTPFSSMDAALQAGEKLGDDKEEIKKMLDELIINENHNSREQILLDRGIETSGFPTLRKELKRNDRHE